MLVVVDVDFEVASYSWHSVLHYTYAYLYEYLPLNGLSLEPVGVSRFASWLPVVFYCRSLQYCVEACYENPKSQTSLSSGLSRVDLWLDAESAIHNESRPKPKQSAPKFHIYDHEDYCFYRLYFGFHLCKSSSN